MTWKSLSNIIADDPYSCAVYANKFNLLNTEGCKETYQNSEEIQVQTSQGSQEIQALMGSSKGLCTCLTT